MTDSFAEGGTELTERASGPVVATSTGPEPSPGIVTIEPEQPVSASGLTTDEETELARLHAKVQAAQAGPDAVRVKVEGAHSSMTHAGVTVGTDFTDVPAWLAPALFEAAAGAGVTLTQEE